MTARAKTTTWCRACHGTGRVDLPPSLQQALDFVRLEGSCTARELHLVMPDTTQTAANNRLEKLRELGWVTRTRALGRGWVYTLVGEKREKRTRRSA